MGQIRNHSTGAALLSAFSRRSGIGQNIVLQFLSLHQTHRQHSRDTRLLGLQELLPVLRRTSTLVRTQQRCPFQAQRIVGDLRKFTALVTTALPLGFKKNDPRIIFGIRRKYGLDHIETIGTRDDLDDSLFFGELKTRHDAHRSIAHRWLSPFRFRYCNFVRVSSPT